MPPWRPAGSCVRGWPQTPGPPFQNEARSGFERLIRKLLNYPNKPAVVLMHAFQVGRLSGCADFRDLGFRDLGLGSRWGGLRGQGACVGLQAGDDAVRPCRLPGARRVLLHRPPLPGWV